MIEIFVRLLTGKVIPLNIDPTFSVGVAKEMIRQREGIPPEQQQLIFAGRHMENGRTLGYYDVQADMFLHLVLRVRGGARTPRDLVLPRGICDDPEMVAELYAHAEAIRELMERESDVQGLASERPGYINRIHHNVSDLKSNHASKIISIVAETCLGQRVKEEMPYYVNTCKAHHRVIQAAMITKNSVDVADADKLKRALRTMCVLYIKWIPPRPLL
ncbi:hypothetical protein FisN_31Hu012 [Fistulifera solaris]|uniref:Ubiquitin-like domain-containing protein n=1 Tax=Fistulifera solaris TaxID=1519565 RepID=A0A1Z5JW21_FISSO|nr:hypothetical protein FisN_31Hu012 [Fistulifera solaris]|eukprot:GAX18235.1 hypothetical protein FisN_31Hu012 [Fistulifera solaris]